MSASTETNIAPVIASRLPAKPPVAAPAATGVALVLALALIAVGLIAARDVLISTGAITGPPWITAALNSLDGLTSQWWMLPAGIAVAILGLLLVFVAVTPRRRTHRPLRIADTWITPRDVTRLAHGAAAAITGVAAAHPAGSARKITLTLTPLPGYDVTALSEAAHTVVTEALAELAQPPRINIHIKEQELP